MNTPQPPQCPDCRIDMEAGYVPHFVEPARAALAYWHRGEPRQSTFLGVKIASIVHEEYGRIPIRTYRCPQCGLLREYA